MRPREAPEDIEDRPIRRLFLKEQLPVGENRRDRERLYMRTPVELELPDQEDAVAAQADNISYGGMGIFCKQPLTVGCELWVKIQYHKAQKEEDSEVVRGRVHGGGGAERDSPVSP